MQPTILFTVLSTATLALSAAIPPAISTPPNWVSYCTQPGQCESIQPTTGEWAVCNHLDQGYSFLTFGPNLSCTVYYGGHCYKDPFVSGGRVEDVTGWFDTVTDARALDNGIEVVNSFICSVSN